MRKIVVDLSSEVPRFNEPVRRISTSVRGTTPKAGIQTHGPDRAAARPGLSGLPGGLVLDNPVSDEGEPEHSHTPPLTSIAISASTKALGESAGTGGPLLARPNQSLLWQTGHTTSGLALRAGRIVLVIGIGLLGLSTGEAVAQGPEPAPVSTRPQLRPEPVPMPSKPVSRPRSDEKSSPTSRTSQRTSREPQAPSTTQSAGTVRPRISSTQPSHSARPSSSRTPTKPVPSATTANQRATGERATTRNAVAATVPSDSESSNLLLFGGLALVALALEETLFLALSIRVLRSPAGH